VVAGPHADEPVGGATALRIAERVLARPELADGVTWNLLLCLDPDGLRRNEGWLHGPYTLGHYFRSFFRPGLREQPEWLPDGVAAAALPETRTLLRLQDELKPFLQVSLHGVDIGGGFVGLTHDLPGLDRRLGRTCARLGVPRGLGCHDALHWPRLGPAVHRIPSPRPRDPAAAISEAAVESTWHHPIRHGTLTAVVAAPMWGVAAVEDGSEPADAAVARRAVSAALRHDARLLELLLARVRPHLAAVPDAARLLAPVEEYVLACPGPADAWDPDTGPADGARPLPRPSTADLAALRIAGLRLALRTAGLLRRLARAAGRAAAGTVGELDRLIDQRCADYRDGSGTRWVPVGVQTEFQTRVVLDAFELSFAQGARTWCRSGEEGWGPQAVVPMPRA
jgi:hypothetical protein